MEISNYGPGGWEFIEGVKPRGQFGATIPGLLGDLPYNPASTTTIPAAVLVATATLISFLGVVRVPYLFDPPPRAPGLTLMLRLAVFCRRLQIEEEAHPHHPDFGNHVARLGAYAANEYVQGKD